MITIKTTEDKYGRAEIIIKKGTPHTTMLLGCEMLIEAIMKESSANITIDFLLDELKRIYIRDNEETGTLCNK